MPTAREPSFLMDSMPNSTIYLSESYIPFLLLTEYVLSAVLYVLSAVYFFKTINDYIVKLRSTVIRFTPCLTTYMTIGVITSFGSVVHMVYLSAYWRNNENRYNGKVLFWTGLVMQYLQQIMSLTLTLSILDRIFHFLSVKYYTVRLQKLVACFGLFVATAVIFGICISAVQDIVPEKTFTLCLTTSCQIFRGTGQLLLNTRGVLSVVNFVAGVLFFLILKFYILRNKDVKKKHIQKARKARIKLIAYAIFLEMLFQFLPLLTGYCLGTFANHSLSMSLGAYNIFFTSIQYALTSVHYYRSFKGLKWRRKPQEIQWVFTTDFNKDRNSVGHTGVIEFLN